MVTDVTREKVTAIVVSHGRDLSFLGDTLAALASQAHQPNRTVVVIPDHGSSAVGPIHEHLDPDSDAVTIVARRGKNLAQILAGIESELRPDTDDAEPDGAGLDGAGLDGTGGSGAEGAGGSGEGQSADWLWIVHADSSPEPGALDALLRTGETSKRIGVVGPKQIAWEQTETSVLLEVGIRATRAARRVPEIEPGERDQGQYDSRTDVLAVGTAGMLVRADVWAKLGGLDPYLGPFGDGLEFSRRARRAGYRVVVEPQAVIRHARHGLGETEAESFGARRAAQMYNGLLAASAPAVPLLVMFYLLAAIPRALGRLVVKEPRIAWAELQAAGRLLGSLGAVARGRSRLAATSTIGADALADLEAKPADIRAARKEARRSRKEAKLLAGQPDPLTRKLQADLAMHTRRGGALTVALAVLFAIAFHVSTFSVGTLSGGGLAADTTNGLELARIAWYGWLDTGDGAPLPLDPLWVVAVPIMLLGQSFGLTLGGLATGALYGAIPFAALFAYLAAGRLSASWVVRTVLGLAWIVAPPFLLALHTGQIGAVVAHVLLPLAFYAVAGAWRGSAAALGLAALTFGCLAAAAPAYLGAAAAIAFAGVLCNRGRRKRWVWLPVPALLLAAPTIMAAPNWALAFAQVGVPTGAASTRAALEMIATDPWAWAPIAAVLAVATLALLRVHRMWWVRAGWLIAALGLWHAAAAQHQEVAVQTGAGAYRVVTASPVLGLSVAVFGLWLAIGAAAHALRTAMRKRSFGATQIIGGLAMVALPIATVAIGARWLTHDTEAVLGDNAPAVPALATETFARNERVLALAMTSDGLAAQLWRGHGQELHEFSMARGLRDVEAAAFIPNAPSADDAAADLASVEAATGDPATRGDAAIGGDAATNHLTTAVLGLLSGSDTAAAGLGEHAVAVVLVPPLADGEAEQFRAELIGRLHTAPGLQYVTDGEAGTFWRVSAPSARVQVRAQSVDEAGAEQPNADGSRGNDGDGASGGTDARTASGVVAGTADIIAADSPQELRLAERAHGNWVATVDGEQLEAAEGVWYQAWEIPAGKGGTAVISYDDPVHRAITAAQGAALVASLVVSLPLRRRQGGIE